MWCKKRKLMLMFSRFCHNWLMGFLLPFIHTPPLLVLFTKVLPWHLCPQNFCWIFKFLAYLRKHKVIRVLRCLTARLFITSPVSNMFKIKASSAAAVFLKISIQRRLALHAIVLALCTWCTKMYCAFLSFLLPHPLFLSVPPFYIIRPSMALVGIGKRCSNLCSMSPPSHSNWTVSPPRPKVHVVDLHSEPPVSMNHLLWQYSGT